MQVYQYAKDNNLDTIWICEDNISASFDSYPEEKFKNLERFLKTNEWGVIFTGGYILRPWDYCQSTKYSQVYETRNNNHGTVSYIIHKRLYNEILTLHKISPINIHFDIFLSQYTTYIYNPLLFYHSHTVISNINKKSDMWRKVWFHPKMMSIHSLVFFDRKWMLILFLIIIGGLWWVAKRWKNI